MSHSFVNSPLVRADIIQAVDYYKNINPELAKQFLFRIREAKAYIALSPRGFQIKYNEVRTLLLKQFPYHIHYLINDADKHIIILDIIHAYKNPTDYSNR
ncbi:type II toxin-antitoxin system RelE/ParE family toxin [Daejeonella sp.]|uniref:type II toxin-antitoxin system RelE/ParE family toxin n=1 Tax=Daejeonella sp. TaxID=2805397 RepID=UPI0030C37765